MFDLLDCFKIRIFVEDHYIRQIIFWICGKMMIGQFTMNMMIHRESESMISQKFNQNRQIQPCRLYA